MNKETEIIMQAMGYNITPSLIDAVIKAYELAKDKGGNTTIYEILKLKHELNK
jgi:hypothetical protein